MIYLVKTSRPIIFTEGTIPNGVTFTNTTTAEVATIVSSAGSGTNTPRWDMTWVTAPITGDKVEFDYDGNGDLVDPNSLDEFDQPIPIKAQTITLVNCADKGAILWNTNEKIGWNSSENIGLNT